MTIAFPMKNRNILLTNGLSDSGSYNRKIGPIHGCHGSAHLVLSLGIGAALPMNDETAYPAIHGTMQKQTLIGPIRLSKGNVPKQLDMPGGTVGEQAAINPVGLPIVHRTKK